MEQLGKYQLLRRLGSGGMGEVFLARQSGPAGFEKRLVVKRILRRFAEDQGFVELFLNEAKLAAMLSHPNIVQIYELGDDGMGSYFIAMEFVEGRSLRAVDEALSRLRRVLAPACAARLCSQVLQGLNHAHQRLGRDGRPEPIVHGDVSPDNVLLSYDGAVKLVDFGLARVLGGKDPVRSRNAGKLPYMAPEQLEGQPPNPRSDIYSSGVLLYELLTGQRPFTAHGEEELIRDVLQGRFPPPREVNPAVPAALESAVLCALSQDPNARFQTAEAMARALEEYVRAQGGFLTTAELGLALEEIFGPPAPLSDEGPGTSPSTRPLTRPLTGAAPLTRLLPLPPRRRGLKGAVLLALAGGVGALSLVFGVPGKGHRGAGLPLAPPPPARTLHAAPTPAPAPAQPQTLDADLLSRDSPIPVAPSARISTKPFAAARRYGRVEVQVNPWAEVTLHGRSLGITPFMPVRVEAGLQVFTLKNSELNVVMKIPFRVAAGRDSTLRVDLLDAKARTLSPRPRP